MRGGETLGGRCNSQISIDRIASQPSGLEVGLIEMTDVEGLAGRDSCVVHGFIPYECSRRTRRSLLRARWSGRQRTGRDERRK